MAPSSPDIEQISKAQFRQQVLLIILCIAVAACTVATWRAGSAMRDANELQKQLLAEPADTAVKQPQKRQSSTRAAKKDSAQSQLSASPREQKRTHTEQAAEDKAAPADLTGTKTAMRSGRK